MVKQVDVVLVVVVLHNSHRFDVVLGLPTMEERNWALGVEYHRVQDVVVVS
jgi:hypothetical protein